MATVPNRQLPPGERHDEQDESVEVEEPSRYYQAEEFERLAEVLPEFQAREGPPGIANRFFGYKMPSKSQTGEARGFAVICRSHEPGVEPWSLTSMTVHTAPRHPVGPQEISNAPFREACEGADPVSTRLVAKQAVSQLDAP